MNTIKIENLTAFRTLARRLKAAIDNPKIQYAGFCLVSITYLIKTAPVLCVMSIAIALISIAIAEGVSKIGSMSNRRKSLFACLLGTTLILATIPLPSYAILTGFETTVGTIIEATGGNIDAGTATLITNILRLAVFVAIFTLLAAGFFQRQNEEVLKGIALGGVAIVAVVTFMEVAGNFIFVTAA